MIFSTRADGGADQPVVGMRGPGQAGFSFIEIMIVISLLAALAAAGMHFGLFRMLIPAFWPNPYHEQHALRMAPALCWFPDMDVSMEACLDYKPHTCETLNYGFIKPCLDKHLTGLAPDQKKAEQCIAHAFVNSIAVLPYKDRKACGPLAKSVDAIKKGKVSNLTFPFGYGASPSTKKPGQPARDGKPRNDQGFFDGLYEK